MRLKRTMRYCLRPLGCKKHTMQRAYYIVSLCSASVKKHVNIMTNFDQFMFNPRVSVN